MASVPAIPLGAHPAATSGISFVRRARNRGLWIACGFALVAMVAPVVWILAGVITRAADVWSWSVFTEPTTGAGGGLSNTILGTLVISFGVLILAGIVGVGSGVYLSELSHQGRIATLLRSSSEVLAGIPSIVFGYCGFLTLVIGLHWGFSLLPALIVLSLLVVPYIAKSTELALGQVPLNYREGGEALGMRQTYVLRRVVMRSAVPGILTGLIVAVAISVGETAPLLYTAGFTNEYPHPLHLIHQQVPYLTYATFTFYDSPFPDVKALASEAALLLVFLVVVLIVASRLIVRFTQRYAPNRAMSAQQHGRRRRGGEEVAEAPMPGGQSIAPRRD